MAKKYPRKPDVVEAVQYIGTNAQELITFCPHVYYQDDTLMFMGMRIDQSSWITKDLADVFGMLSEEMFPKYYNVGGPAEQLTTSPIIEQLPA